ncbi:MAG: UDP-N-acetylmuramoyl-L-alanyl-D-glutamate--2,6-diaminopimelate ligase [bacterium]|nr:UDP-N-acetylmuramoyl-L-alanyl-D-glutamate--2,6-diaminopimelate ligase [bacterium]
MTRREASLGWLCALPGVRRLQLEAGGPWGLEELGGDGPLLRTDSRRCRPGDLFVALRGYSHDGHGHAPALLANGFPCVVEAGWHLAQEEPLRRTPGQLVVEDTQDWLPRAVARIAGLEQADLVVHGVTGTNGKTSTTWILQQLLRPLDPRAGLVGTICSRLGGGEAAPATLTTPDSPWLAAFASRLLEAGGRHLVMEVSSHAIHQRREAVFGFRSAVFLNLSPEHLDYHQGMEDYFRVKASFLRRPEAELRLVNTDCTWGRRLAQELDPLPVVTFGREAGVDWRLADERGEGEGQAFRLLGPGADEELWIPLPGSHNASNAAAAWIVADSLGIPRPRLRELMADLDPVPGRMEPLRLAGGPRVLIDYAHSPDGYEKAFAAVAALPRRRLHVLFGCGGERDRGKRPVMLRIALVHADRVWLTLDNPRGEDPAQIFGDILAEQGGDARITRLDDRAAAIAAMLAEAGPEDLLLLLGKGHERYQLIGTEKRPFDEREVLRQCWERPA